MKKIIYLIILSVLCNGLLGAIATGDKVPKLDVSEWVKGNAKANTILNDGKISVLFFWTTTQRSTQDFPTVAKIANKYKDNNVQFIGIGLDNAKGLKKFFRLKELPFSVASDNQLKTTYSYLRSRDKIPFFAVISSDGQLLWRGELNVLDKVLKDVTENKFDLQKQIEHDTFADELFSAMNAKNYTKAISIVDKTLSKNPENAELIVLKANILGFYQNKIGEAITFLQNSLKSIPNNPRLHAGAVNLIKTKGNDAILSRWYDLMIADCVNSPIIILSYAEKESAPEQGLPNLNNALKLAKAAKKSNNLKNDIEKAHAALTLSRIYYLCANAKLALKEAQIAQKLFKGTKQEKTVNDLVLYYQGVVTLEKSLEEQK